MIFQESETVELKSIVVDDIKKEIIAFANCEGGKLYIGVQDDGTVIGVDDPDGTALQVSNMVRDAIKPDLTMFLHYQTLNADGKQIVAIDVQQGTERPYYIAKKGLRPEGVFVRQGSVSYTHLLQIFDIFLQIQRSNAVKSIQRKLVHMAAPENRIFLQKKLKEDPDIICVFNPGTGRSGRTDCPEKIAGKSRQCFQNFP